MGRTMIIAEAGVNHNGDIGRALEMIRTAAECGADYVKFQTFHSRNLVSRFAELAQYQKASQSENSQLGMLQSLELPFDQYDVLLEACGRHGIGFLSTPFDLESIDFLNALPMDFWKIPSGEISNLPYLRKIAATGKKVVLSCGMSTLAEVSRAMETLRKGGTPEGIVVLHCNTQYPTPLEDVNLNAMETLRRELKTPVGYSDHTLGIEVSLAAAALGAVVIEKHFTLDRRLPGPDHKASLEPGELKEMIRLIRNIETALGGKEKKVSPSERENLKIARKSIVAAVPIPAGTLFSSENITVKRPGNGLSPFLWDEVIGQVAKRDFMEDELIEL